MALKLFANYSKRLGLPGYSSHEFAVSVETEARTLSVAIESAARPWRLPDDPLKPNISNAKNPRNPPNAF